jgi:hypothetical protein
MTDQTAVPATTTRQESHQSRLLFEQIAGYGLAAEILILIPLGMVSDSFAMRVVLLAPAAVTLGGLLFGTIAASLARGHFDERLNEGVQ